MSAQVAQSIIHSKASLARLLVEHFAPCSGVISIYLEDYGDEYQAVIFTRAQSYDKQELDELLEAEYELRDFTDDINLDVHYLPLLDRSIADLLSPTSELIYPGK